MKDPAEQAVLIRMRKLRKGGSSLRQIVEVLNADGVPSKRCSAWSPSSISRILDPAARERARQRTQVARRR